MPFWKAPDLGSPNCTYGGQHFSEVLDGELLSAALRVVRYGATPSSDMKLERRGSADPTTSVLDVNCEVHGLQGPYVINASVLPRAGAVGTGLTIIAQEVSRRVPEQGISNFEKWTGRG